MELVATLPVVSNLPWIAALAGGLPTAAGVYVASKIFQEQVDRLSSAKYSVKGDWNNPELKFDRVFDDRKKSRSVKKSSPVAEPDKADNIETDTEIKKPQEQDIEAENNESAKTGAVP